MSDGGETVTLGKRDVLVSTQICRACKEKIVSSGQQNFTFQKKSRLKRVRRFSSVSKIPAPLETSMGTQTSSSSPADYFGFAKKVPLAKMELEEIVKIRSKQLKLTPSVFPFKTKRFTNLAIFIIKTLFGQKVTQKSFEKLSGLERQLLLLTLKKKGLLAESAVSLCYQDLSSLCPMTGKRVEENLKFIVNRGMRFLRRGFAGIILPNPEFYPNSVGRDISSSETQQRAFYSYYFEESVALTGLSLNRFFFPVNQKDRKAINNWITPKTVSKLYFRSLLISPLFVKDFRFFLEKELLSEIKWDIVKKVSRMVKQWVDFLKTKTDKELLEWVELNFRENKKCKLAWGLDEVRIAIGQTLKQLPQL